MWWQVKMLKWLTHTELLPSSLYYRMKRITLRDRVLLTFILLLHSKYLDARLGFLRGRQPHIGVPTYYLAKGFADNFLKMKEFESRRGARPWRTLGFPLMCKPLKLFNYICCKILNWGIFGLFARHTQNNGPSQKNRDDGHVLPISMRKKANYFLFTMWTDKGDLDPRLAFSMIRSIIFQPILFQELQ